MTKCDPWKKGLAVQEDYKDAVRLLYSVLGPALQERYGSAGAYPEQSNEAGNGYGTQLLGGAERAGVIWRKEDEGETSVLSTTT